MLRQIPLTLGIGTDETFVILLGAAMAAGVVLYVVASVRGVLETRAREQTKREVAAYVAEGSILPADAVRLLGAGDQEAAKMIADGVAWGTIKPEKAVALIHSLRNGQEPAENKS